MKINIGYLYYDLMNLYGDVGNLNVISYHLKNQGIEVNIDKLSIDDDIDFDKYNLIYIGSGTENNRFIGLKHLLKYKKELDKYIKDGRFILSTGNSLALFGKSIDSKKCLGLFDFSFSNNNSRVVDEMVINSKDYNVIYGFCNHQDKVLYNNVDHLFENEGIKYKNFYGTYLIGPILVRNYNFCEYFIRELINNNYPNFDYKDFNFKLDKKAYEEYILFKNNKIHIK